MNDTIYALSSGTPPAAIAVVRISGPLAEAALETMTGVRPEPRRAALVTIRSGGEQIDRGLALRFPGPNSATGEDIAELHVHGGRAVVAAILAALSEIEGLREAEPGEFTRRAFENGRIDLAEAEGLADLLTAETEAQRRAALALAGGALSRQVEDWRQRLLALSADVEAVLDFSDEGEVADSVPAHIAVGMRALSDEMRAFLARPSVERLRDGVRVAIAGPPNSGKSSLFNALVQRDAAITSEIAGTTRDLIEAPVAIGGAAFVLVDTAGLRQTRDAIEKVGVERALASIEAADLVLWLGKSREAPAGAIRVHSKSDVTPQDSEADIAVSALTGAGLGALTTLLLERSSALLALETGFAINARHRGLIENCSHSMRGAADVFDPLLAAEALRQGRSALDRLTGRAGVEDMLDALFGRFCVGK